MLIMRIFHIVLLFLLINRVDTQLPANVALAPQSNHQNEEVIKLPITNYLTTKSTSKPHGFIMC
jgi:hypothetical protein